MEKCHCGEICQHPPCVECRKRREKLVNPDLPDKEDPVKPEDDIMYLKCSCGIYKHIFLDKKHMEWCNGDLKDEEPKWISVKDRKPKEDCVCYVMNCRGGDVAFVAVYQKNWDVFRMYDREMYYHPCIDTTHWYPLPAPFVK